MRMQALVVMPFGQHHGIDFDAVFAEHIKPALDATALAVFRADSQPAPGAPSGEFFKQLLRADLVLVDETVPEPNPRYPAELLGALRARDVLHLEGRANAPTPADADARRVYYRLQDGRPDARYRQADRAALARRAGSALTALTPPSALVAGPQNEPPARRVFLFSGHMIDAPERREARFPPALESAAALAIGVRLDEQGIGHDDLAICGGACGGDLLFAEAALRRKCRVELYLQYREVDFLKASVAFAGDSWVARYAAVKANALTTIHVLPDELGQSSQHLNAYVRNNLWQLCTALAHGVDRLRCITLWDGQESDGAGGTEHLVQTVRRYGGQVSIVPPQQLVDL